MFATFLLMSACLAAQSPPQADNVLREGQALVAAGKLDDAQALYARAMQRFPDNPDFAFELGMVFFREHDWAKAIENYRSSLSLRPRQIKGLFYLAESYFAESDSDQAIETMEQAAAIAPNDAQVCQKFGEYLAATLETRRKGLSWLQKARALNPKLERIDFEIGKAEFDLTDFQSAAIDLEAARKGNPNYGEAGFFLAESQANLGEWDEAQASYRYALSHDYKEGPAYYGLGKALVQLGEFVAALEPLQHALQIQPSLIQAHFQLSKAYRQLDRLGESRREAQLFAAMNNRVDTSRELNGIEYKKTWRHVKPLLLEGKEQQALEFLAALPSSESNGYPYYLLGVMYNSMGRQSDAARVLAVGRTKDPANAHLAAYLGMVQLSSGEPPLAEHSLQDAIAINPAEALALIGLGSLEYQKQHWTPTIEYLEKSRTADPGVLYMLCDAYFSVGNFEDAMLTVQVIRSLGADRPGTLAAVDKLVAQHETDKSVPAQ